MMEKMKIEGSALKTHFLKQINIWQRKCQISVAGKRYMKQA